MTDQQSQLDQAYNLILVDRDDEALEILRPIVEDDPTNADAWWLLSYAVTDPKDARFALVNVLKNNPNHAKARELLGQVNEVDPPSDDELELLSEVPEADVSPATMPLPEAAYSDFDDDIFGEMLEREQQDRGLPRPIQIMMFVTIIAIVAILAIALLDEEQESDEDTGRADLAALQSEEADDMMAALDLGEAGEPVIAETDLGNTLFVETCVCTALNCGGPPPQALPQVVLEAVREAVSEVEASGLADELSAVGVNVLTCQADDDDTLYRGYISLDSARELEPVTLASLQENWTLER